MSHSSGSSVLMYIQFLNCLFEFQIRTKIESHIKNHISIEKHFKSEISKLKFKTKSELMLN